LRDGSNTRSDVTVQGAHDADPREHRRAAVAFGDQDQDFNGSLPFLDLPFCLRQLLDISGGILRVTSWRPLGNGIGSSNGRFQSLGVLREEISALLRERQVSAGRMQRDPAVRDGGFNRSAVFLIAAASFSELPVDDLDRQPPGMVGLNRIRQLKQFSLGGLGRRERAIYLEFHRACTASAAVMCGA
jgi:hypothetical protein